MFLSRLFEKQKHRYQPLNHHTIEDNVNHESETQVLHGGIRGSVILFFSSIAILFLSLLVLVIAVTRFPTQLECAKLTSPYSPIWEAVEFWEGDFNNDFFHKTVYRGPPTAERELAWDKLWRHGIIGVPAEGVAALNKTDSRTHHQTVDSGRGVEYGAMVEMFHQLHCLNLIRQYTLLDQYDINDHTVIYPTDLLGVPSSIAREHVDHCIETLRLSLMCYGDITPLFFDLDPNEELGRIADFNVHHKCRKFDNIVDWVAENQVRLDYTLVHTDTL